MVDVLNSTRENRQKFAGKPSPSPGIIWLGTNTCDGNIISTMNTFRPSLQEVLEDFDFYYSSMIMAPEGESASEKWRLPQVQKGAFILVVEGTVPTAYGGKTAVVGQVNGQNITALELVKELGTLARWVVAAGVCASFGGPYAAYPNPTGSVAVSKVLNRPVINVPGCPVNPRWVLETLYYLKEKGAPELDPLGRPRFLYKDTVHSRCEFLPLFEAGIFAQEIGQKGCTYLLGCKGPSTRADCPVRLWNDEKSAWNVGVNSICIGCTSPEFPDQVAPFFKHETDLYFKPKRINLDSLALGTAAFTLAGIGAHLAGKVLTGRVKLGSKKPGPTLSLVRKGFKKLKDSKKRLE